MSKRPLSTMDIDEFVKLGYLQELNRRFLHPFGVALAVRVDTETGKAIEFSGIWDGRHDLEGMYFGGDYDRDKVQYIDDQIAERWQSRVSKLGSWIEGGD